MKIIYGREGQPAGSPEGEALYGREGKQIGFLDSEHIYAADEGEWLGSIVSGVVFNAFGDPVGFAKGCKNAIPLLPPAMRSMLPPKLKSIGEDVRAIASETVPPFLKGMDKIPERHACASFFL